MGFEKNGMKGCAQMKKYLLLCVGLWLSIFIIPIFTLSPQAPTEEEAVPTSATDTAAAPVRDAQMKITVWDGQQVLTLPLNEYLLGVVASEMPALFPEEALKAQAVAARTYALNRASLTPAQSHHGAMVCTDPSHCKAYKPFATAAANWGISREQYSAKITSAVADTDGQILLYDGKPISAVFHSASAGKTENASDVWGGNVPYLQSVDSFGEQDSPAYYGTVEIPTDEFKSSFLKKWPSAKLDSSPDTWFKNSTRSGAGGVINVYVGGVKVTGNQIRSLCGLRSTNFTVKHENGKLIFNTLGYGHCVGMSQYGARAMAKQGKNYREILTWYYKGVTFGQLQSTNT